MTAVADPYERDDDDFSIVPDVEDVTQLEDADVRGTRLDDGVTEDEDADLYTRTVKAPGVESEEHIGLGEDNTQAATSVPSDPVVDPVEANPLEHGGRGDEGTSLGDEDTPVTPQPQEAGGGNLEHGLGNPGGSSTVTLEEGTEFGLGSDNTQDTPPVLETDEVDPLRHGLGQADGGSVD